MYQNDEETLPNFIKRKHPEKGREKETKTTRTKVQGKQAAQAYACTESIAISRTPYEQEGTDDSS